MSEKGKFGVGAADHVSVFDKEKADRTARQQCSVQNVIIG